MRKTCIFLLIILSAIFLTGCAKKQWTGYYYPAADKIDDKSTWIIQPGLNSLEDCREWVNSVTIEGADDDYQCGFNCRFRKDVGETVCESDAR